MNNQKISYATMRYLRYRVLYQEFIQGKIGVLKMKSLFQLSNYLLMDNGRRNPRNCLYDIRYLDSKN